MKFLAVTANGFALLLTFLPVLFQAASGQAPSSRSSSTGLPEESFFGPGLRGGTLVISSHSEPKTLNPLVVMDSSSRQITGLLNADLVHINGATQETEPALAESWSVSEDGRRYVMRLRRGVCFSDGSPFDADDVVFSFNAYLDGRVQSPQRDLLFVAGRPIKVEKIDQFTVAFSMNRPYAAAERLFDGIEMLPHHLLEDRLARGTLRSAWSVSAPSSEIAGLGPFRLQAYTPGQRILLERNPFYWKRDNRGLQLPYLDRISVIFVANTDAEVMRFEQGETDVIDNLDAQSFALLDRRRQKNRYRSIDLGPGLEYDFLFFNENSLTSETSESLSEEQKWFDETGFRQAVSNAIDRDAIVRLAYFGRATALATPVTPGNKRWLDPDIVPPARSLAKSRRQLLALGFSWTKDKSLVDRLGKPVRFSMIVNAAKPQQVAIATLIQQDLDQIGIRVNISEIDFHSLLDRVFSNYRYEAAVMALADGDADPNSELNVLTSTGTAHVWKLKSTNSIPAWQREIDSLFEKQLITPNYEQRRLLYNRVQQLVWENMPVICLVSPHILVAAKERVGNFRPAILGNHTLWNADRLFLRH